MADDRTPSVDESEDERSAVEDEGESGDPDSDTSSAIDSDLDSTDVHTSESDTRPEADARTPNTLLNALVGASIAVITAFFVPLSPVLGGAIAGYLEASDTDSGLAVGALSGAIALVPLLVVVPFVLIVFAFEPVAAVSLLVLFVFIVGFLAIYTVGFGALGGVLGVYLYEEFER